MRPSNWTRRQVLRGAGIALSLPWLETFAPRTARAQAAGVKKRYIAMYFPNGTADFWKPTGAGVGDAWKLSPILEPLAPVKKYLTVIGHCSNYSPHGGHAEPSHSNDAATSWSCVKPSGQNNGITVDQLIANGVMGQTQLHSLQVGLSTLDSSPDGLPGQHSRSMSWKSATEPLYKVVNPQAVFDRLVAGGSMPPGPNTMPVNDPLALRRKALNKSALDYVRTSSTTLQTRLGKSDKVKLEQFLTSVRDLEKRVADPAMGVMPGQVSGACTPVTRHANAYGVGMTPPGYNRETHALAMIDLVTMALQCDITRSVNFMLDDARSDFVYSFVKMRNFTAAGSTEGTGTVGSYHGLQHAGQQSNGFATIGWWNALMASKMAQKLMAIQEGAGGNMLDNTVIAFLSGMKGGNHDALDIPIALIGGGGGVLKTDIFHPNSSAAVVRLVDVHTTYLQKVFGVMTPFGAPAGTVVPALLT